LKRNNYCLYNLGVYIIIAIRIIMIIVILSKVAKHGYNEILFYGWE
jgi:hypothetical protein